MRSFDYKTEYAKLLTPDIVALTNLIHELKGEQKIISDNYSDVLVKLVEIAKIQSTEASNRIEGIVTTQDRLNQLVREKTMPKNRSEQEIAGYRDVLGIIHESHEYIPLKSTMILQLHRDLYRYSGGIGGSYKNTDNVIAETLEDGTSYIRFTPAEAWTVPDYINNLCDVYNETLNESYIDPLILTPMFVLDFLCIHPFKDGNGRMSRLLTLLLLYRAGYDIGKYISIEKLIADSKETYYEALQNSSTGWHESENSYEPFVKYLLGIIVAAYKELADRTKLLTTDTASKPDRVRYAIQEHLGQITKTELMEQLPDISQVTIQRALADMLDKEEIIKIGGGRYTSYIWNRADEMI